MKNYKTETQYQRIHPRRRNQKNKHKKILFICLISILSIFFFSCSDDKKTEYIKDKTETANIQFEVKEGDNLSNISSNLKEKDLILSTIYFNYLAKKQNLDTKIPAGIFQIPKETDSKEILQILLNPQNIDSKITIPEGYTIKEIDQKLTQKGLIKEGEFINCINKCDFSNFLFLSENNLKYKLEGYLFPDTYYIKTINFESKELINKMLRNFEQKINTVSPELLGNKRKLNEKIIMASIIEKEVMRKNEMHLISGILWKRHNNKWGLGADATLLYEKNNNIITTSDLNSNSDYNTRKFRGLPPGPISNPGINAIKASLYPTESSYWFYLTTLDTGEVKYAKTNDEHNINKVKYLK